MSRLSTQSGAGPQSIGVWLSILSFLGLAAGLLPLAFGGRPSASAEDQPPAATCGNYIVEAGEQCDRTQLSGATCPSVASSFTGGVLRCDPTTCTFDTAQCRSNGVPLCGDSVVDGDEECERGVTDAETCASTGLGAPDNQSTLYCTNNCRWNDLNCSGRDPTCGDGVAEIWEECDGTDFRGVRCENLKGAYPYGSGTLSCNANCNLVTSGCVGEQGERCGNGVVEAGEQCDGSIGTATCRDAQRYFGRPQCNNCKIDYGPCWGGCNWTRLGVVCN